MPQLGKKKAVSNELLDFLRSPDRIIKVSFHLFYDKVWEEEHGLKEELFNFKAECRENLEGSRPSYSLTFHLSMQ